MNKLMKKQKQINAGRDHEEPFYRLKYRYCPEPTFRFDQQYPLYILNL